jgi:hypothetical protein
MQLNHLGIEGHLLTGKLAMAMSCPPLDVDLPTTGLCLLPLLVSLLLIREELHSWLGYHGPNHDHRDGLQNLSVVWGWHGEDGVS